MNYPSKKDLLQKDRAHLIHTFSHPDAHKNPHVFVKGRGARLIDIEGNEYIDGLSGLWNVTTGHGRDELVEAATQQMRELAFCGITANSVNIPAVLLAEKVSALSPRNLTKAFFVNGGSEAVEAALQMARFYWKVVGKNDKTKFISLELGYHGTTFAARSVTGLPAYWNMLGPLMPGFIHIPAPYEYRFTGNRKEGESVGEAAARALEEMIQREGPDTIAAFIAEPILATYGPIVPPPDYFQRVREICTRHNILFIADEILTGFGKTGRWFALSHWGVEPDLMAFGKSITNGYFPLAGVMADKAVTDVIDSAPYDQRFLHGHTTSGHPVGCAIALRNIELIETEGLVERAGVLGVRLMENLRTLYEIPAVGEVRGLGLIACIELVKDRETRTPFDPALKIGQRVSEIAQKLGLIPRVYGDNIKLGPPLIVTETDIDAIVEILRCAIKHVTA